jgi:HK97 gp10 family phage protein
MPDKVTVDGDATMVATLGKAITDLGDLAGAGHRAASVIVDAARGRAPRRTGALAGSISAGPVTGTVASVKATVRYGGPVHWGTRHMAAQPFLSDAATATEGAWLPLYETEVARAVDQVRGA